MSRKLPSNPQFDQALVAYVDTQLRQSLEKALEGRYYWRVVCIAALVMNAALLAKIWLGF